MLYAKLLLRVQTSKIRLRHYLSSEYFEVFVIVIKVIKINKFIIKHYYYSLSQHDSYLRIK